MRFRVFLVLFAVLIVGPAYAQKIYIDYDREYDASKNETFAWHESEQTSLAQTDPMLHSRIASLLAEHFVESGYKQDDDDPDLYVTYHGSSKAEMSVDTSLVGYGYPTGWAGMGYGGYAGYHGTASTTVTAYQIGTLVVDVWDAETETIVWRGIAADIVIPENPMKLEKKIEKALKKMIAKWGRMKRAG